MRTATPLCPFDMATFLDSPEAIAEYLSQVLAGGDPDELLRALGHVAKARGVAQVAREADLPRESLDKALRAGTAPRFDTVVRVGHAMGLQRVVQVTA